MRRLIFCLLCILAVFPASLSASEKKLSADLAMVPRNGLFFAHVRLQDIYKSDQLKELREIFAKAGAKALMAYDSRFFPTPSSLDRATVIVPDFSGQPIVILTTTKAIDKESFLKFTVPEAKKEDNGKFGPLFVDAGKDVEMWFAGSNMLVMGPVGAVGRFQKAPKAATGNLSDAIKLASSGKAMVAAFNVEAIPAVAIPAILRDVPPPTRAMLEPLLKAKLATVAVDLRGDGQIDLRLAFGNAKQAGDADVAVRDAIKLGREFLEKEREAMKRKIEGGPGKLEDLPEATAALLMLGIINTADEYLAAGPVHKDGTSLLATVKLPAWGKYTGPYAAISLALLVPAVQKVRAASDRVQSVNNLKQIALAMHNYHDAYKHFPAQAICDKNGKPLLSWRVSILPYIEQAPLYQQFKLDEPWDSEHNRKLIPLMPNIYVVPAAPEVKGQTFYRVFVGGGAAFEKNRGVKIAEFTDGTSNTILCVEASESVPWTKPDDLVYDAQKPLPKPANFYGTNVFMAAFADGSVRALSNSITEATLRAFITRAAGDIPGADAD
jgi:hypothetical protein